MGIRVENVIVESSGKQPFFPGYFLLVISSYIYLKLLTKLVCLTFKTQKMFF